MQSSGQNGSAIWEQREDESTEAFAAFELYCSLGSARSVDAVDAARREAKNGGRSAAKVRRAGGRYWRWAAMFEWVNRARAYDEHMSRRDREAREAEQLRDMAAYRERCRKAGALAFDSGLLALGKANTALRAIEADSLKPGQIANLLRAAADLIERGLNLEGEALGVAELALLLDQS